MYSNSPVFPFYNRCPRYIASITILITQQGLFIRDQQFPQHQATQIRAKTRATRIRSHQCSLFIMDVHVISSPFPYSSRSIEFCTRSKISSASRHGNRSKKRRNMYSRLELGGAFVSISWSGLCFPASVLSSVNYAADGTSANFNDSLICL